MANILVKQVLYENFSDNKSEKKLRKKIREIYNEEVSSFRKEQFKNGNILKFSQKFELDELDRLCYESATVWKSIDAYLSFMENSINRLHLSARFAEKGLTLKTTTKVLSKKIEEDILYKSYTGENI